MTEAYDLVIVGGGASGASAFWHATTAGMHTLLIERTQIAGGPTGSSTANIRCHYSTPELADIAARSSPSTPISGSGSVWAGAPIGYGGWDDFSCYADPQ